MSEPFSSLSDEAFSERLFQSQRTRRLPATGTIDVANRVQHFRELFAALTTKPEGSALLYRLPGKPEVCAAPITNKLVIGRNPGSELESDAPALSFPQLTAMSRLHFEVAAADDLYVVRDLGSRNGTYVNGGSERITETLLKGGDIITAGGMIFAFTGR